MNSSADRSIDVTANRTQQPEQQRFEALCTPLKADLFRFLYWLCRDRALAEDVLQETLLRAWKSIESLSDEKAVRPWLLTIARRELARTYERKRIPTVELDSVSETDRDAFAVEAGHDVQEMRRAIMQLDAIHREPLVLQVMFGYSTEEISQQLQISLPAVLTRLHRARHALRKHMLGDRADEGMCE
jgi:RNA polymerase sigma-70 factor (ECF subfamily)